MKKVMYLLLFCFLLFLIIYVPQTKAKLQEDNHIVSFTGYKRWDKGETYPALSKLDCKTARYTESCLPISPLKCMQNKCQKSYTLKVYRIK